MKFWVFLFLFSTGLRALPQSDSLSVSNLEKEDKSLKKVLILNGAASVAVLSFLWVNWYGKESINKFHFNHDHQHFLQMDKMGHGFSTYYVSSLWASELKWAKVPKRKAAIYGTIASWASVSMIEVMDGFSHKWGFSPSDLAANSIGAGLFLGQELAWGEQRITAKWSYHKTIFPDHSNRLGDEWQEWLFDYNGQTYWLSFNINSFIKESRLPKILNLAIGYGAENMITDLPSAEEDLFNESRGTFRTRQFYIAPDLDLARIPTKSPFLRGLLKVVNAIKIPMPTVEFNREGGLKFHPIYF